MIENILILSALALIYILIYFDNHLIKVSKHKIKSDKIPKEFNEFKIVQLSDFHSCSFGKNNIKLIKKINNENPNIIIMTGDMVNKYDTNFEKFLNLAEVLGKKYNTYYVLGNHEERLRKEDLNLIIKKLDKFRIKVLNNEKINISRKKDYINL